MNVHKLWTDDRAVSPVVGVALLIAITVILAAVIGGVVLGLGTSSVDAPQASLQFEQTAEDGIMISHQGGETLNNASVIVRGNDTTYELQKDLSAGESYTIESTEDVVGGDRISVVWQDPNSNDESVIARFDLS